MLTHTKFDYFSDRLNRLASLSNAKMVLPAKKSVAPAIVGNE